MYAASLAHLRDLCLALPDTVETGASTDPNFSVRGQTFATGHRVNDRESVWFKASDITQRRLLETKKRRFFVPRYLGRHGWLGAWLDGDCDWSEIDDLIRESYAMSVPALTASHMAVNALDVERGALINSMVFFYPPEKDTNNPIPSR